METSAERLENNRVEVTVTIDADDVNKTIASTYKDLAKQYRFPGFRPGHAPRPVVDSTLGHDAVMAQATQNLVDKVEPSVREKEDIVPVGDASYPEPAVAENGKDFTFKVQYVVRPVLELNSFDPVDITLPSDEATDAEVDAQIETFRGYFGKYEDIEGRAVEPDDFVYVKLSAPEEYKQLNFNNRLYHLGAGMMPKDFDDALIGMKPGDEKTGVEIKLEQPEAQEGEEQAEPETVKLDITLNRLVEHILPEIDDAFAKDKLGFDDVAAMREAISKEIGDQKKAQLPQIKENRVTGKLAERLQGEPSPEYVQTVFQELGQNFLNQLQSRGQSLDAWLQMNGISSQQFMSDLNRQATDIATESLALDALVAEKGFDCTEEDIDEEFKKSGVKDWEATKKQFLEDGRMPAVRVSIRRNKAIDWLLETANVTISDEPETAEADQQEAAPADEEKAAEEKPAKKTTKRSTKKAAAEDAPEAAPADETAAAEEKPAKKTTKRSTKKAAAEDAPAEEAEAKKPARKTTAKKSTKKAAEAEVADEEKAE